MKTVCYDGTFRGLLTAVRCLLTADPGLLTAAHDPAGIDSHDVLITPAPDSRAGSQPTLFAGEAPVIAADPAVYAAFTTLLENRLGRRIMSVIRSAFLSEWPGIENALFTFIRKGLAAGPSVLRDIADDDVHRVLNASRKTLNEANKYKGILRFSAAGAGLMYARIAPDTHILPVIAGHFKARFPQENWVIHDTGRNLLLVYEQGELRMVECEAEEQACSAEAAEANALAAAPDPFVPLWKKYYSSMSIDTRRNTDLQRQFLPLKRRKYIVELDES